MSNPSPVVIPPVNWGLLGSIVALVLLLVAGIFWAMGLMAKEPAMLIMAVCATRL